MTALKNVALVLGTAVLVALVAGPVLRPAPARADGEIALAPSRALVLDGVKLSVTPEKKEYAPGEKPVVTLCAVNTGDQARTVDAEVLLREQGAAAALSRVELPAVTAWTRRLTVEVPAGGTKQIRIETDRAVAAMSSLSLEVRKPGAPEASLLTLLAPTPAPAAAPTQQGK